MTQKKKKDTTFALPPLLPYIKDVRMEMTYYRGGCMGITLFGCTGIVSYSHECVMLRLNRRIVRITGDDLWCRSYGNRTAEVAGRVEQMTFAGEEI